MTVSREATLRAKRVLGSKILCVVNVYGLEEGLHASRDSPDYVEDDQDYLDFLTDSLQHGDGEGPIASLIEERFCWRTVVAFAVNT